MVVPFLLIGAPSSTATGVVRLNKSMPFIVKGKLMTTRESVAKMTMQELIDYEAALWGFMTEDPPFSVVTALNNVYQEVEWRAAHPHRTPRP